MESEPDDDLGDLGGLLTFPDAKRHYYLGGTFALLGDHSAASTHARTAIDLYQTGPPQARSYGDEALARLDLARAGIHAGDIAGAALALDPVLELPAARRIHQIDMEVAGVDALLAHPPLVGSPAVRELRDRIDAYRSDGRSQRRALDSAT